MQAIDSNNINQVKEWHVTFIFCSESCRDLGPDGKTADTNNMKIELNLSCFQGKRVGLLDSDVFGPTIPLMMNLNDTPLVTKESLMVPLQNYGVKW